MDTSVISNDEQNFELTYNNLISSMSDVQMWKGIDGSGDYNGGKGMKIFAIISILVIIIAIIIIWKVVL